MAELTTNGAKILFILGLLPAIVLGMTGIGWAVEVGEKAPNFTLTSTTGKAISLSQFQGKKHILLEFYTADFGAT